MTDEQEAAFQSEYRTAITRAESDEDMARRMFEAGMEYEQRLQRNTHKVDR